MKIYKQGMEIKKIFQCDVCECAFEIDYLSKEDRDKYTKETERASEEFNLMSKSIHVICPKCGRVLNDITDDIKGYI